jgi:phospholipid/cholesterol/gamma-HCH transport system permease protein
VGCATTKHLSISNHEKGDAPWQKRTRRVSQKTMPFVNVEHIGRRTLRAVEYSAGAWLLLGRALRRITSLRLAPVRTVLYRQIYFTGVEALYTVALIGVLLGIVIITQVASLVGSNAELTGRILIWTVVRELGPLLTAILIVARSCTAVAAEIGAMTLNDEVSRLRTMGIDPTGYLYVPRILGMTGSIVLLTLYFQFCAIVGGIALSSLLFPQIPFFQQVHEIFVQLSIFDIQISFLKSVFFGLLISTVSCYHGARVEASWTQIPQVTAVAVMHSLFFVFVFDGVITAIAFL